MKCGPTWERLPALRPVRRARSPDLSCPINVSEKSDEVVNLVRTVILKMSAVTRDVGAQIRAVTEHSDESELACLRCDQRQTDRGLDAAVDVGVLKRVLR